MPLFSVIIPSYNRADLLVKALESVFAQEFTDYEIIVVDDGSTDDTVTSLKPLASRLTLLQQKNRGPGAARNLGAKSATGEYLAFLDSDDLWFPWTLAVYAKAIDECGNPSLLAGRMSLFLSESELEQDKRIPIRFRVFPDYLATSLTDFYCGSGQIAVRRSLFLDVGGFAEKRVNAEDHDFALRMGIAKGFVYIDDPCMVGYRQHPQGVSRDPGKTFEGVSRLIEFEQCNSYPGGPQRKWERRRIIARHVRPVSIELTKSFEYRKAFSLYRRTAYWHLRLGRLRYLLGFIVVSLMCSARSYLGTIS